jgi:hypothetical protein
VSTNAIQLDGNEVGATVGAQPQANVPVSVYKVVSRENPSKRDELFTFRAAESANEPQPARPEAAKPGTKSIVILVALAAMLGVAAVLAFTMLSRSELPSLNALTKSKPVPLYVDMGNRRFDPAGLAGRLIVRWDGNAAYQLYLDPLDPQQMAGFQTLAEDPPHPLSVLIRLLDASGLVACEKEIVFPTPARPANAVDPQQALIPRTTSGGDTVQGMAGSDGQIAEITSAGPLPCSIDEYRRLTGWQFSSNFPTVADQEGPLARALKPGTAESGARFHSARGWRQSPLQFERLAAPIEGDDMIVGDNAARGTVDTNSGRVFLVVASAWRTHMSEWQIFPAAIHFRCEKTGVCTLTRMSSRTMLQARLMR